MGIATASGSGLAVRRGQRPAGRPRGEPAAVLPNDGVELRANGTHATVTWVGHSTFLVQLDGVNILTDPHWSERASPVDFAGPRRLVAPGLRSRTCRRSTPSSSPTTTTTTSTRTPSTGSPASTARASSCRSGSRRPERARDHRRGGAGLVADRQVRGGHARLHAGSALVGARALRPEPPPLGLVGGARPDQALLLRRRHRLLRRLKAIGERLGPFDLAAIPIGGYSALPDRHPNHVNPEEAVQSTRTSGADFWCPCTGARSTLNREPFQSRPNGCFGARRAARPGNRWRS